MNEQNRFYLILKKVLSDQNVRDEEAVKMATSIIQHYVSIDNTHDEESLCKHDVIYIGGSGRKVAISKKVTNIIVNWKKVALDAGKGLVEGHLCDWTGVTLLLVVLGFCIDLYGHTEVELSEEHVRVFQALWYNRNGVGVIDSINVQAAITHYLLENDLNVIPLNRIDNILNDLQNLRSIRYLQNGDLQVIEELEVSFPIY